MGTFRSLVTKSRGLGLGVLFGALAASASCSSLDATTDLNVVTAQQAGADGNPSGGSAVGSGGGAAVPPASGGIGVGAAPAGGVGAGGPAGGTSPVGGATGGGPVGTGGDPVVPTGGGPAVPAGACGPGFWTDLYSGTSGPSDHQVHYAGEACLRSGCHDASARTLVFAGTAFKADSEIPAANAQIGVKGTDGVLHAGYSGVTGNFWVLGNAAIDWASAQICIRTANGELLKDASLPRGANCNDTGCHTADLRIPVP